MTQPPGRAEAFSRDRSRSDSPSIRVTQGVSRGQLARLLDLSRAMNSALELQELGDRIVDAAIDLTSMERGFFVKTEKDDFDVLSARNVDKKWIREGSQRFSRTVLREVLARGRPIHSMEVLRSDRWRNQESLVSAGTRVFLCVPIRTATRGVGALYLDSQNPARKLSGAQILLAEAIAEQAATAWDRIEAVEELHREREKLRYLNQQLTTDLSETKSLLSVARGEKPSEAGAIEIIGQSRSIRSIVEAIDQVAASSAPVYIFGESGTGKELAARALHLRGPNRDRPFLAVTCSEIPKELFESSFFGHQKGAFTGAQSAHTGFFVAASGGTLFLDAIDELPIDAQAKLLRALEESRVRPLGSSQEVAFSVRIVTASNRDLDRLVAENLFREDLYYRLHVVRLDLPPLRERAEDIPMLVEHFLRGAAGREGVPLPQVSEEFLSALIHYGWPGNVRQLKNEIDRMISLLPKNRETPERLTADLLSAQIRSGEAERPRRAKTRRK